MRRYVVTSYNPDRCAVEVLRGEYATHAEACAACPVVLEHVVDDYDNRVEMYHQAYDARTGTYWTVYGPGY